MSASLQHRLTPRWSVLAAYNDSRAAALVPLPGADRRAIRPSTRSSSAGPASASAGSACATTCRPARPRCRWGARPGAGGGRIEGTLFLDLNGNGQPDAGETRLPNVDLVLDGRFSVRSDAQGRFEFPFVASGRHMLSVIPDNVPLPWGFAGSVNPGR